MSKRQNDMPDMRRAAILNAAKTVFSLYGYQRASMADIAQAAGLSRPALYEHFRSKEDVFRTLATALSDAAIEAAEAAWPEGAGFTEGLTAAVLAKDLEFFRLIHLSPHGAEILAQHQALTGALHRDLRDRFAQLVSRRAGGGDDAELLGLTIAHAMEGLKSGAASEDEFVATTRRLCAALGAGVEAGK
jgi:AcrR family transcriptional regulator